jgi:hypothetical protein
MSAPAPVGRPRFVVTYEGEIPAPPGRCSQWQLDRDGAAQRRFTSDDSWSLERVFTFAAFCIGLVADQPVLRWEAATPDGQTRRYHAVFGTADQPAFSLIDIGPIDAPPPRPRHRWWLYHDGRQTSRIETNTGTTQVLTVASTRIKVHWNRKVVTWLRTDDHDGPETYEAVLASEGSASTDQSG